MKVKNLDVGNEEKFDSGWIEITLPNGDRYQITMDDDCKLRMVLYAPRGVLSIRPQSSNGILLSNAN